MASVRLTRRPRHLLLALLLPAVLLAALAGPADGKDKDKKAAKKFRQGRIEAEAVQESSGIVASRRHDGVFWTINDSGNAPSLYAITREGELLGEFPVAGVKNDDWEDLAIDDDGYLYVADVGNNERGRDAVAVYRVREPDDPRAAAGAAAATRPPLRVSRVSRLTFPDKPFDCEALFVLGGSGYLIPKQLKGDTVEVYRFDLGPQADGPAVLEPVTRLPIRSPVTAADVSPDGKRLAVLTVNGPSIFRIDGDVANAGKVEPAGVLFVNLKMEAACFVPDGLLVTTEDRDIFLFRDKHFGTE